jgi:hypothetical protein
MGKRIPLVAFTPNVWVGDVCPFFSRWQSRLFFVEEGKKKRGKGRFTKKSKRERKKRGKFKLACKSHTQR